MDALIQEIFPYYRSIRQQIHQYPELRYEEKITAQLISQELQKLGLTPQENIGKTGVVAVLDSGKPGKTVALRADMDALPIQEESSTLPYCSKNNNKMHACGHDGHVASLLGAAHILSKKINEFSGKIKFIFQPAEEGGAGAKAMIEDGVLENPPIDAIFAYHNHPGTPIGKILAKKGCTMYGNFEFLVQIQGKSGHAAMPEWAINPINISALVIQSIQDIMLLFAQEKEPTIITVTQIKSGIATNIIPETATLGGTVRAASLEKFNQAKAYLEQSFHDIQIKNNVKIELLFQTFFPPTINTDPETEFVLQEATQLLGQHQVAIKPASGRASEDFSYFLQKVPGCYFFIGNGEDSASCHNSKYNFNDDILPTAMKLLSTLAISFLNQNG